MKIEFFNLLKPSVQTEEILDKEISKIKIFDANVDHFKLFFQSDLLAIVRQWQELIAKLQNENEYVVLIGTGGATNNPSALCAISSILYKEKLFVLDDTCPEKFLSVISKIDLAKTLFISISNSGETLETLALTHSVIHHLKNHNLSSRFLFITKESSSLGKLALENKIQIIPHEAGVCGRFSGFGATALIPAAIMGINLEKFVEGVDYIIADFWKNEKTSLIGRSAAFLFESKHSIVVNLNYASILNNLVNLHCQVLAESSGKEGKGVLPINNRGPFNQHSYLQLYLDGPKDKFFNVYAIKSNYSPQIKSRAFDHDMDLFAINDLEYQATSHILIKNKLPVRLVTIQEMNEYAYGKLFTMLNLEVILFCLMLNIDPFTQDAVEQIKLEAKKLIG